MKINHFYQHIHGWFDFEEPYQYAVEHAKNKSVFVEVGSWMGKSTAFMATEIANTLGKKEIEFFAVDTWEGSPGEDIHVHLIGQVGDLYSTFLRNVAPVSNYIVPLKMTSVEASKNFEDESVDFIWIDAGHTYEDVKSDLEAWFPKLKKDGIIGGHDYSSDWPGVVKAVNEFFGATRWVRKAPPSSWIVLPEDALMLNSLYK